MEENAKIMEKEVKDVFEGVKAKRHPPPEEKIDPVKAKRTLDALQRPPPSPPKTNYERITERHIRKQSVQEVLAVKKGYKNEELGKNSPAQRTSEPIVPPAQGV